MRVCAGLRSILVFVWMLQAVAVLASGCGGGVGFGDDEVAYADLSNTLGTTSRLPLRGRLVREDGAIDPGSTEPFEQASQDEIRNADVRVVLIDAAAGTRLELGTVRTNDEGYLDTAIDLTGAGVVAGRYRVEVFHDETLAGSAAVRLLDEASSELVVRSDIDLTWLLTDFHSSTAILDLLGQDATERVTLPGMELVYRALRRGAVDSEDLPLIFLSGSPTFFKRTLEGKAVLDSVEHDGIVLKPFADIITANLLDIEPHQVVPELKEQVGYKLYWMLRLREDVPANAREILLGDDSEADFVVYALYHRFTAGELDTQALLAELDALGVAPAWSSLIAEVAPRVEASLGASAPVQVIYINRTDKPSEHFDPAAWVVPGVTRRHRGAWPLALDLHEEGRLSAAQVESVRDRLEALGEGAETRDAAAAMGVSDGFLEQATVDGFP